MGQGMPPNGPMGMNMGPSSMYRPGCVYYLKDFADIQYADGLAWTDDDASSAAFAGCSTTDVWAAHDESHDDAAWWNGRYGSYGSTYAINGDAICTCGWHGYGGYLSVWERRVWYAMRDAEGFATLQRRNQKVQTMDDGVEALTSLMDTAGMGSTLSTTHHHIIHPCSLPPHYTFIPPDSTLSLFSLYLTTNPYKHTTMRISRALLFAAVAYSAGADAKLFGKDKRK